MPADYIDLPIYRDGLAKALRFTPSDLDANRAGRLSPAQRTSLLQNDALRAGVVVACLLMAIGSIGFAFANGPGTKQFSQGLILAAGLVLAAGALGVSALSLWRDLNAGIVSSVSGMVEPAEMQSQARTSSVLPGQTFWTYAWAVGGERFAVSPTAYAALTRARHRLYFLPRTRRIVSAEPIAQAQGSGP